MAAAKINSTRVRMTRKNLSRWAAVATALSTVALLPVTAAAQAPDKWQFGASVYAYLPTIGGAVNFPVDNSGTGISVDAGKILDALKFTFMGSLDAHHGRWGLFTDLIYMNVGGSKSQTRDFSITGRDVPAAVNADLSFDLKGTLWTVAGEYRVVSSPTSTVDLLAGARMFDLKPKLGWSLNGDVGSLALPGRSGSKEVGDRSWDGIVGLKGFCRFGPDNAWNIPFYADVGAGQSQLTWQAGAGLGYSYAWGDVIAMWRYIGYEFKSGKNISDLNFNGPMVGAVFRW
jgi:hypothetical protein